MPQDNMDSDLLATAREVRGVEQLQADPALLEEIRAFFSKHEAENARLATHAVIENYPDWWTRNRRAPPGLDIKAPDDLEELYRYAGTLHGLGIPLTLAERRTKFFRFFQDVEVWGSSREEFMPSDELIGPDRPLTRLLGEIVGEVFPQPGGFLDAAVYDASGLSQTKGVRKTSVRLVWPGIVVDSDRATRVRDLLVYQLGNASAEGGPLAELEARLQGYAARNAWHNVFADAAYSPRAAVRMPLSDRVSPLPLRAPERRPLAPVGVLRFTFAGEGKLKVEWLCQGDDLDGPEWVKIGALRQSDQQQLSVWSAPSWPGNQPMPPSLTRNGRVKVRTAGGSDGGGGIRLPNKADKGAPERAGQLLTVERKSSSAPEDFAEKMEQHLGAATVEPDGALVWKQPGGDARIVMHGADRRVKVIGRPHQVRSLVVLVSPYTEAVGGLGQQRPDGRGPGQAYAPVNDDNGGTNGDAAEGSQDTQGTDSEEQADETTPLAGSMRVATRAFESEGQGELALSYGDSVCVVTDLAEGDGQDRWVYGRSEASGACGWFPLSHTIPRDEWQTQN